MNNKRYIYKAIFLIIPFFEKSVEIHLIEFVLELSFPTGFGNSSIKWVSLFIPEAEYTLVLILHKQILVLVSVLYPLYSQLFSHKDKLLVI